MSDEANKKLETDTPQVLADFEKVRDA